MEAMRADVWVGAALAALACACSFDLDAVRRPGGSDGPLDAAAPDGAGGDGGGLCGALGQPCCGGTLCREGACLLGSCAAFAGAYQINSAPCVVCPQYSSNPYGSSCNCPSGFSAVTGIKVLSDCPGGGMFQNADIVRCEAPSRGSGEYAGMFQKDDDGSCAAGNPFAGNACDCPPGTVVTPLPVLVQRAATGNVGSSIWVCRPTVSSSDNFGGFFQLDDVPCNPISTNLCRVANPVSGACSCPAGFSATRYRALSQCLVGLIGTTLYFCTR